VNQPPRPVRHLDRENLGNPDDVARFPEDGFGSLPVRYDHAKDAELLSVGEGHHAEVDSGPGELPAGLQHLPGPVFQKY